jgi:hypothetical protein
MAEGKAATTNMRGGGAATTGTSTLGRELLVDTEWLLVGALMVLVWLFSRYLHWRNKGADKKEGGKGPSFLSYLKGGRQLAPSAFVQIPHDGSTRGGINSIPLFCDSGGQFAVAGARSRMRVDESNPEAKYRVVDGIFEDKYLKDLIANVEATEYFGVNSPSAGNITGEKLHKQLHKQQSVKQW